MTGQPKAAETEHAMAVRIATRVLDTKNADPDSDESIVARQFLRSCEGAEAAYSMLSLCGVPRERAKSVSNGIDVLATRYRKDKGFDRQEIAQYKIDLEREVKAVHSLSECNRALAEALVKFGQHRNCGLNEHYGKEGEKCTRCDEIRRCTCGLSEAISAARTGGDANG